MQMLHWYVMNRNEPARTSAVVQQIWNGFDDAETMKDDVGEEEELMLNKTQLGNKTQWFRWMSDTISFRVF